MKRKHFISITVFIIGIFLFAAGSTGYAGTLTWNVPEQEAVFNGNYYYLDLTRSGESYPIVGTSLSFYASITPFDSGTVTASCVFTWKVDGSTVTTYSGSTSSIFSYAFSTTGYHSVQCIAEVSGIIYTMPFSETITGSITLLIRSTPTPTPTPTQVTMTIATAGGYGTTNPSAGSYVIPQGSSVTLSASPLSGYVFKWWQTGSATVISYSSTVTVTVSQSTTYTAVFEPASSPTSTPTPTQMPTPTPTPQVTLEIGKSGSGTITPSAGTYPYNLYSSVTISAIPASGYQFDYWLFDDYTKSYSATTTISMSRSKTALAVFSTLTPSPTPASTTTPTPQVTLTIDKTGSGTIAPANGTYPYNVGFTVSISAMPASGSQFDYWLFQDSTKSYYATSIITMSTSKSALAVFSVIPSSSPSASPTPAPTPLPTATPAPTTQPTTSPAEPTPIPVEEPSITPEPFIPSYFNANELAMVSGLCAIAIAVIIEIVFFLMKPKR